MAVDVIMPQMGESIFEGTITRWLKKPGDRVERDEPLFEISTDKVDAEIPAPSAGVLKEIKVNEGQTVPIQTVVAVIDAAGAAAGDPPPHCLAPAQPAAPEKAAAPKAAAAPPTPAGAAPSPRPLLLRPASRLRRLLRLPCAGNGQKIRSSPLVRKLAKEHNVDLGADGRKRRRRADQQERYSGRRRVRPGRPAAPATPPRRLRLRPSAAPAPPPGPGGRRLRIPRLRMPCRASAFISATTKRSR